MNIAIIGTGNVGSALATRLSAAGHKILLGVKDPSNFTNMNLLDNSGTTAHSVEDAINGSEAVILAVPSHIMTEMAKQIAPLLGDKVVIDPSNPMFGPPTGYKSGFDALKDVTKAPHIVKCFNCTFASNLANPKYGDQGIDMFIAGSSAHAKDVATALAKDVGFAEVYDFGGDEKVALIESLTPIAVNLAYDQGMGTNFGLKILKR